VRGTTTSAASVTNYNFTIVCEGVDLGFETVKFANISFSEGGVVYVIGDGNTTVVYSNCDIQNIAGATGSGVLVNSTSPTSVVDLFVLGVKVTNVSVPEAVTGGLFFLSKFKEILLSRVRGLHC
jgi:hypothetical protein